MSRIVLALVALASLAACTDRPTEPKLRPSWPSFATDPGESGPPSPRNFGPDSYRLGVFTGAGTSAAGLDCSKAADKSRVCSGFLASAVDGTLLDVTVQVPAGGGPFPLVVLMHGWAGSKTGSGDVADALVSDGLAVLRYSARGSVSPGARRISLTSTRRLPTCAASSARSWTWDFCISMRMQSPLQ